MKLTHKLFLKIQDLYIQLNSYIKPEIIHNAEKHTAIKKFLFYKEIEGIEGDYIEFGSYEGTSIKGAAVYWRKIGKSKMNFYAFDSFQGMKPEKGDEHPFYTTFDFSTEFGQIKKRFKNLKEVKLIPGFFDKTLAVPASNYGIKKVSIAMVDCDLYSSSKYAFKFLKPLVHKGTILILDDYFNYLGDKKKGLRAAFDEFKKETGIEAEEITRYGIGGIVFVITDTKK